MTLCYVRIVILVLTTSFERINSCSQEGCFKKVTLNGQWWTESVIETYLEIAASTQSCAAICMAENDCNAYTFSTEEGCVLGTMDYIVPPDGDSKEIMVKSNDPLMFRSCTPINPCDNDVSGCKNHYDCKQGDCKAGTCTYALFHLLVGTGTFEPIVEVIDLKNPKGQCEILSHDFVQLDEASGGLLNGDTPVFCGGFKETTSTYNELCYVPWGTEPFANVSTELRRRVSLQFDNGTVLLAGGLTPSSTWSGVTHVFDNEEPEQSLDMPFKAHSGCFVNIDGSKAVLISGFQTGSNERSTKTKYLDFETVTWTNGPDVSLGRNLPTCGVLEDSVIAKKIVVLDGGIETGNIIVKSTELLDVENNVWHEGPEMIVELVAASAVSFPTGKSVIVSGGKAWPLQNTLYEIKCADMVCQWNLLEQRLLKSRAYHVSMLIPKKLDALSVYCGSNYEDCFTENVGTYGLNVAVLTMISSPYDCIQQCQSNLRCMVWTFSQSLSTCWMKQGLDDPAFYYEEGAVTGPRACVGGCIERNVDVVGNNIPGTGLDLRFDTPEECQAECRQRIDCVHWIYVAPSSTWKSPTPRTDLKSCWLKSLVTTRHILAVGLFGGPKDCNRKCFEYDTDFNVGNLIGGGPNNIMESPEECRQDCQNTYNCIAWAYVSSAAPHPNKKSCWLKSTYGGKLHFAGVISGPRHCKRPFY